jgi:hypothetical protein
MGERSKSWKHKAAILLQCSTDERRAWYFNIDQIRLIDEIRPGHCRVWFSETHSVEINGEGAALLMARISDRAIELDGTELHIPKRECCESQVSITNDAGSRSKSESIASAALRAALASRWFAPESLTTSRSFTISTNDSFSVKVFCIFYSKLMLNHQMKAEHGSQTKNAPKLLRVQRSAHRVCQDHDSTSGFSDLAAVLPLSQPLEE